MNRIENHVQEAQDYVDTAKQDTKKAIRYQSRARRVSNTTKNDINMGVEQLLWLGRLVIVIAWTIFVSSFPLGVFNWCCHYVHIILIHLLGPFFSCRCDSISDLAV